MSLSLVGHDGHISLVEYNTQSPMLVRNNDAFFEYYLLALLYSNVATQQHHGRRIIHVQLVCAERKGPAASNCTVKRK